MTIQDPQGSRISLLEAFLSTEPTQQQLRDWINALPIEDQLECELYLVRRGPTSFVRVVDPKLAFKDAGKLTDEALFQELAKSLGDTLYTTPEGKIGMVSPKKDPEPINRFASLYNEAVSRGFQRDDIGFGMRPYITGAQNTLPSTPHDDPVWVQFEKLVSRIHAALCKDAEVRWSEKLPDKSGVIRQIDVTIRSRVGPHRTLGIVQCKYSKRPVSITDVEAFAVTKADLNAELSVMVSHAGYQEGAIAKGEFYGIRLWTLQEAEKASWKDELRTYVLFFHQFSELQLHPPLPDGMFDCGQPIELANLSIHNLEKTQSILRAFSSAIQQATQACLPIPCWFDMSMPAETTIQIGERRLPLERISFHFTHKVAIKRTRKLSVPFGTSYVMRRTNGETFQIADRDLPPYVEPE